MKTLDPANEMLNDSQALAARADNDGFLYFCDVLDEIPLKELKQGILEVLVKVGLIRSGCSEPIFSGQAVEGIGRTTPNWVEDEYNNRRLWERFVEHPSVTQFFERVFGEPVVILPMAEYRTVPPGLPPELKKLNWHQDGFRNPGLDLWVAWIPLVAIDEPLGGLALAAGMNKVGFLHANYPPPLYKVPDDAIPDDVQHRMDYEPGDVVLFSESTPHTGLPNETNDRVRVSVELRLQRQSSSRPLVGAVSDVGAGTITIIPEGGTPVTLTVDGQSMIRGRDLTVITPEELGRSWFQVGRRVVAAVEADRAVLLRPATTLQPK